MFLNLPPGGGLPLMSTDILYTVLNAVVVEVIIIYSDINIMCTEILVFKNTFVIGASRLLRRVEVNIDKLNID